MTYVGIVDEFRAGVVVVALQVDGAFEAVLWNEHLDGVLADEEHVRVLVVDPLAEEHVRVQRHRSPLRVLRHFVPVVEVVAQLLDALAIEQLGVRRISTDRHGHQTVHHQICVPEISNLSIYQCNSTTLAIKTRVNLQVLSYQRAYCQWVVQRLTF